MCMITYVPSGIEIPIIGISNGAATNDDGHGWAVASKDGLVRGGSMDSHKAITDFIEARANAGLSSVGLFHSRWGTHGVLGEFNIHPFYVSENSVMAHNGILPSEFFPEKGDKRSDTRIFVDRIAKGIVHPNTGIPSRRDGKRLADAIGSGNKLVFLSATDRGPKVRIVNAWAGVFTNGVWYSNSGYKNSWSGYTGGGYSWSKNYNWDNRGGTYGLSRNWDSYEDTKAIVRAASLTMIGKSDATNTKATGLGYPQPAEYRASIMDGLCPQCYSDDISTTLNYCRDCYFCLDCNSDAGNCLCDYGAEASLTKDERDATRWWDRDEPQFDESGELVSA